MTARTIARSIAAVALAVSAVTTMSACESTPAAVVNTPQTVQEDDPNWDWRTMGNTCRGIGNGALECVKDPFVGDLGLPYVPGTWTWIDESSTWVFCPAGRSDIECGA